MQNIKKLAVLLLPFVLATAAQGAGFALYEYSARSTAMGGATMANGAEAASLATNPALITELEGTQVQLGVTAVSADATTTVNGQSRSLKDRIFLLPNFYVTQKWSEDVTLGLGGFSRFGLGGEYQGNPTTWYGSNLAYKVDLETFSLTPTIAVKANEELSIAMGLEAMVIGFAQESYYQAAGATLGNGAYKLSGSGVSWGGNFSLSYKPQWAEKWSFGAMYRSKIKQDLNGRLNANGLNFNNVPNIPAQGVKPINIHDGNAIGSITLPDSISAGVAFKATDDWTLEAGIVGTFWSSYDQILIQYKDTEVSPFINNQKKYKDVYRLNFGTEYKLNTNWAVRAGYVFDKSPINHNEMDTLVPVDDRHLASVGVGYAAEQWSVDLSYTHIFGKDLSGHSEQLNNFPVQYTNGKSEIVGLTVGYKF